MHRAKSIFKDIFAGRERFGRGMAHLEVLDRLLRATTLLRKKVHPADKILATPMPKR